MNSHKNARLTFEGRTLLIERMVVMGLMPRNERPSYRVKELARGEVQPLDDVVARLQAQTTAA